MKRRLNLKYLGCLLGVVLVLGGGVHLLRAFQMKRNAAVFLARSEQAEQEGDTDQALEDLNRYLVYFPDNTGAWARFGLLLEKRARTPRARSQVFEILEQVLRRDPGRDDVRRRLVNVAMDLGRFADARAHLDSLLRTAPDDRDLQFQRGQCSRATWDFKKARDDFTSVLAKRPDHLGAAEGLAWLYRLRLKEPKKGDEVLDGLVQVLEKGVQDASPVEDKHRLARAYLIRAAYRRKWDSPGANNDGHRGWDEDVRKAQWWDAGDADVIVAVAEVAEEKRDTEKARETLRQGIEKHPRNAGLYWRLADLEAWTGQSERALVLLRDGLKAVPQADDLEVLLAGLLLDARRLDEAEGVMKRLRERGAVPLWLAYLDARLQAGHGNYPLAISTLERFRPQMVSTPVLAKKAELLLGHCHGQLGDTTRERKAYERALALDPSWVPARAALADADLAAGHLDRAEEQYRQLMAQPGAPGDRPDPAGPGPRPQEQPAAAQPAELGRGG